VESDDADSINSGEPGLHPVLCYRRSSSILSFSAPEVYVQVGDRSAQLMSRVTTLRTIRQKMGL
ncbi:MAG: hypothetical protein ACO4AJ_04755, partial [Prochlorothrix sp.]